MARTLLIVVLSAAFACPAYGALRFWFSLEGVAEQRPIDGTPPEYINPYTGINPLIGANVGSTRLYLWATVDPGYAYWFASFDLNVYTQAGDVALTDSRMYNYFSPYWQRWGAIHHGTVTPSKLEHAWMAAGGGFGWGIYHGAFGLGDLQFDPETHSMLLGYLDLTMTADASAEIFFAMTPWGFAGQPPVSHVSFGWGDEAVDKSIEDAESTLADATIRELPAYAPGDLNCDGHVDGFDIDPFVLALTSAPDFEDYYAAYPDCDPMLADIDGSGHVDGFDIDPFVELLSGP